MQMLLLNPRSRRRRKGKSPARRARRRSRPMTAKQLKYFGKGRRRVAHRSVAAFTPNPAPRRRRRSRSVSAAPRRRRSRGFRRNPINLGSLRGSFTNIGRVAVNSAIGGAGAVVADVAMGNALRFLPIDVVAKIGTRYGENGFPNPLYYGAKLALITGLGVAGAKFAPGRMKGMVVRGVEGAYAVAAYEMLRLSLPAGVALGAYANSARVVTGSGVNPNAARSGMGAYARLAGLGAQRGTMPAIRSTETRIGEGAVR